MVIGPNGEQMGIKNITDALTLANYAGLDLVLMNGNSTPAVAKIMDYNKYKYERNKKLKEAQKNQRAANKDVKEYLESKCLAELIASIPLSSLDKNARFLDKAALDAINDIADLILIQ